MKYKPINYREWILGDNAREGINIKRLNLLTNKELDVFNAAISYQDQRNDPGQGEIVTYFGIKLLDYFPGVRDIVVSAAICHDTGFYGGDPTAWKKLVDSGKNTEGEINRRPHQNRGCLIAGKVFQIANYPDEKYHNEIADVIGDHDTRKLPTTESGKIVRAADLLWRVTYPCAQIYFPDSSIKETFEKLEKSTLNLPDTHKLEGVELQILKIELANTLHFKFGEKSKNILKQNYSDELKIVQKFYNEL